MSGRSEPGTVAEEAAALGRRRGEEAPAPREPVEHMQGVAREGLPGQAVGRRRLGPVLDRDVEMILQVLADAGQVMHERDPVPRELPRIADARQHQELRRHEGTRRQDDLAAVDLALAGFAPPSDPVRALALHHEAGHGPVAEHREVLPVADWIEIGPLGGLPLAVALRKRIGADAVLTGAVEIRVQGIAGLLGGFEIHVEHRVDAAERRDIQRSRRAVEAGIDLRRERFAAEPDVPPRLRIGQQFENARSSWK